VKSGWKHRSGKVDERATAGERRVLALWERENEWVRHGDVLRRTMGVNRRTMERILLRLVKENVLERREEGPASYYRRQEAPKEFEAVKHLSALDSRLTTGMAYEFEVGGGFSHVAFGRLVGFPNMKEDELRNDEREVLRVLTARLGFIFQGLYLLRNAILIRRIGAKVPINEEALRTFFFESVADHANRSRADVSALLDAAGNGVVPEVTASVIRENVRMRRGVADLEQTVDFFLSEGTVDEYLDEMAKSNPKFYAMSVPQLLKRQRSIQLKESRFVAEAEESHEGPWRIEDALVEIPQDMADEENDVRRMLAYRVGEALHSKGLKEVNELGLVVTQHPWTSSQYVDDEMLVFDAVRSLAEMPFMKGKAPGTPEFAREAGEHVAHYHNLNLDSLRSLRRKPWFKRYIASHWSEFSNAFAQERAKMKEQKDDFLERFLGSSMAQKHQDGKSGTSA
jgi:predicted transcriptional regulator